MKQLKRQRLYFIILAVACLSGAVFLMAQAARQHITFFYTPSDTIPANKPLRLGGLVKTGSLKQRGSSLQFEITDGAKDIVIMYNGILPDLFREGQGVVAEGQLNTAHIFEAQKILAKHDETYMPPEVADALKKKGLWKPQQKIGEPNTSKRQS